MNLELHQAIETYRAGRIQQAAALFNHILRRDPNQADALFHMGMIAYQTGRADVAADLIHRAMKTKSGDPMVHHNLGCALWALGRMDEAAASLRQAIAIKPDYFKAYNALGAILADQNKFDEAAQAFSKAIELEPNSAEAHSNMGVLLRSHGKVNEAIGEFSRAIELAPTTGDYHTNLATAFSDQGELDAAMKSFARAVELKPNDSAILSNYLYSLHFHPGYDSATILAEHRKFDDRFGKPARAKIAPHENDRSLERRLRVGYVSPDFRNHPVGRFLLPLLQNHDHGQFEIFCYSDVGFPDEFTQKIAACADVNRSLRGLAHGPAAQAIRRDRIDILVDLTLHMGNNRLPTFAMKPAPIQVTYLGYCSTTGLEAIDYRLTDPWLDPEGDGDANYCERSVRLPKTYWCYAPEMEKLNVSDAPVLRYGNVTFGCLNNFAKSTPAALETWAKILLELPDSRLLVHAKTGDHRQRVLEFMEASGIDRQRISFADFLPLRTYFALYGEIDITLDPFPYCGGTTTCDSLWMGVPVVTLRGRTAVGRGGVSILNNVGMGELIAQTPEDYIRIAVGLAKDRDRLVECRRTLRGRMLASPLMDAPGFARDIEKIYRGIWQTWCA
jgi:protein O-GlcNAc transferase